MLEIKVKKPEAEEKKSEMLSYCRAFNLHSQPNKFWNRQFRDEAAQKRMPDGEYQKLNAQKINGVTSTDAKIPITIIIRNEGLRALDGIDLLVPTPFAKDLWVALQRRGVRASGLRDEFAAHLESKTLFFRSMTWNQRREGCLRKALKNGTGVEEVTKEAAHGMLIPVKLEFVGRGRPKRFGMICLPAPDDLISIRRNRNKEIIQQPRGTSSEEPMEIQEEEAEPLKPLQGFVSLDAAASEKPISLKWLFEESSRLDDTISKRKRANRKKKESRKRRKLTFEQRKTDEQVEEAERHSSQYRFSADREIIGRLVAGEQSVLGGRGVALGYICADALPLISSNYHK
uniref:POP1 C-terminal domain-containing protein n=1 Tax=Caenorhabditis japonica TaxID=281687 RepID=A0A8R1EKG5_CAEJA